MLQKNRGFALLYRNRTSQITFTVCLHANATECLRLWGPEGSQKRFNNRTAHFELYSLEMLPPAIDGVVFPHALSIAYVNLKFYTMSALMVEAENRGINV